MSSEEQPPPPADVDPTLTVPPSDLQPAAAAAADVPVPPTDPRIHANPPQSDTPTAPSSQPPPAAEASSIILSPIPKKSNVSSDQIAQSPSSQTRSNSFDGTSSLNLPEGVVLPPTVTPELINKVTGSLKIAFFQLSPSQMNELLSEYDEAIRTKGSEIRSHEAYFFGVLKRYRTLHQRSMLDKTAIPQGDKLTDRVLARLDLLVQSGYCTAQELDMKVKTKLKMLPELDALNAIDEINAVPRAEIRNFGSYFMGILNRYMRGERQNQQRGGGNKMHHNQRFGQMPPMMHGQQHAGPVDPVSLITEEAAVILTTEEMIGIVEVGAMMTMIEGAAGMGEVMIEIGAIDAAGRGAEVTAVVVAEVRALNIGDAVVEAVPEIDLDVIVIPGVVLRIVTRTGIQAAPYGMGAPGMLPPPPPPPPRRPNIPMQMGQQMPGLLPGQTQMMPACGMQQPQQMGMGQQGQYYQQPQLAQQQPMYSNNNVSQQVQSVNNAALGQALMPQGMMGMQARGSQVNRPPMSQNQGQLPLDILALADKASQALSSVQPPANPNFPPPPMQQQSFQQKNFASEQDLSTLVQYALQNLRTTGHVEQQLDGKICSMLKRLPEHAALQALETFSSCEVSKMRSKGGYLAGILKKELVKLGL
eukprot:CAMPEP_0113410622 /NCGR_PEP_ID=MMETSP0013_2-20120614/21797_1 /TAXON_ID=2843 ORGANISM="Skeletonema costatum, Strain 1716" /NCGR_SAMPLE_ID=MMETSP0013_2 /ASSEMBLY_ACC=CAM_ASM_000158 /LENGTH=642 /DNA_ID=CAMNT_0000296855 /DNA_START=196 /DNA_END=2124 /DNA_ORIENTATION=- /assembly_acc=CAM_ASM_000158